MLCYVHPDCGGSSGVMADAATPKVSKQPGDQGGRCPTRRAIGVMPWSLVQRCLSKESKAPFPVTASLGSEHLSGLPQPSSPGCGHQNLSPHHPPTLPLWWGAEVKGSPGGLGTSQTQLSFVVSQPACHGYPRLRRQKGAVSCCSCSPQTLPWEE